MPTRARGREERGLVQGLLYVDLDDLFDWVRDAGVQGTEAALGAAVLNLCHAFRECLRKEWGRDICGAWAFSDFLRETSLALVQQDMARIGIQPMWGDTSSQSYANELRIYADCLSRLPGSQFNMVAVVAGTHDYRPMGEALQQFGVDLLVGMPEASSLRGTLSPQNVKYVGLLGLGSHIPLRRVLDLSSPNVSAGAPTNGLSTDSILTHIHAEFGDYDEIYLTPLLRSLDEHFAQYEEPKTIVQRLEQEGFAVLEKRRGNPYDYTVLVPQYHHPLVDQIWQ